MNPFSKTKFCKNNSICSSCFKFSNGTIGQIFHKITTTLQRKAEEERADIIANLNVKRMKSDYDDIAAPDQVASVYIFLATHQFS